MPCPSLSFTDQLVINATLQNTASTAISEFCGSTEQFLFLRGQKIKNLQTLGLESLRHESRMEIDQENHRTSCKRSRARNGKLGERDNHQDEDEDDGETKGEVNKNKNNNQMLRPWHHPSSRIFRVSRASGGKDRHSKVYTSKGLRDRRVRLSVSTAIQFYDLQDRLGYDQPSKAIEWLIKSAASSIAELPSLDTTFPELQQLNNIEKVSDSIMDPEADFDPSYSQQQNSSTSETSKGSVLSLSRSEIRVKARERARERVKEKDRDDPHAVVSHQSVDPVSLNSQGSFTKLLTGASSSTANFIQKQMQSLPPVTSTADYFSTQSSLFGHHHHQQQQHLSQTKTTHQIPSGYPSQQSQAHFGNNSPIGMVPFMSNANVDHPSEMQQFPFFQDHFFPLSAAAASNEGEYNLNFSPSLAGFHRGTLQSNSPSHHHQVHAQRISPAFDGSSVPFFLGTAVTAAPTENPYSSGFEGNLQLCDGYKHLELKGKGKS